MSAFASEETSNQALIQALKVSAIDLPTDTTANASTATAKEFPKMSFLSTSLNLSAILKGSKK